MLAVALVRGPVLLLAGGAAVPDKKIRVRVSVRRRQVLKAGSSAVSPSRDVERKWT